MEFNLAIDNENRPRKAVCKLRPASGEYVSGIVEFEERSNGVRVYARIINLSEGKHGFHIHEGKECGDDFEEAGGHFNPLEVMHGRPTSNKYNRHAGDLGNLNADEFGNAKYKRIDKVITLTGPNSIIGRTLIVHENPDDFETQPTGNSGRRLACGVIEEKI